MTALPHSAPAHHRSSYVPTGSGLSITGIIRSEWIKLWTLRSTVWSFAVMIVISLGMAALMSFAINPENAGANLPVAEQANTLVLASTFGLTFGQLIVAVLGVLIISGEYSTGMIKSTLTAVPRRLPVLWAKAAVLFAGTFLVGAVCSIGSFLLASAALAGRGVHANLLDSAVALPLLGSVFFLAVVAVFALGIGTILRSSAGGIAAVLGILLILPGVLTMIPADWAHDLVPYLFTSAGYGLASPSAKDLLQNLLIMAAWLLASVAGAALSLKRRDA